MWQAMAGEVLTSIVAIAPHSQIYVITLHVNEVLSYTSLSIKTHKD